ncbi:membrane protein DedA, SNARE-associated domain [Mycolicibacterium rutilum]|uniref:Membrane protein DedA, SNARE-associated domain n=1 Tax=Mycolicibacterium rutilum TaxID=370526 RepID=A0A1H6JQ83_MYCRU|nr:DedA family protein [Mycolicibacterium rutilum]SEH61983.1 membrane protein DedA, SNARE-associated domain [Mycolicibacterium rutilum]
MDTAVVASSPDIGGAAGWAVSLMNRLGGVGAGAAIALESIFPPLPSEIILPLAGLSAARGEMSLWEAIAGTTAGSVVGAMVLYLIGARLGRDRVHRLVGRLPLFSADDLAKSEAWFRRYGSAAVLIGRMIPVVRSLVSIPAGMYCMPFGRFVVLTAVGSATWNGLLVLAGYQLGDNWEVVSTWTSRYQYGLFAVAGVLIAVWLVRRRRSRAG